MFVDGSRGVVCGRLQGAASRRRDAAGRQSIKPSTANGSSSIQSITGCSVYSGTRTEYVIMPNSLIIYGNNVGKLGPN